MNGGRVRLLDLPRLRAQLVQLERRTARGGRDTVDHAPGGHDDLANAAAGALLGTLIANLGMYEYYRGLATQAAEPPAPGVHSTTRIIAGLGE